MTIKKQNIILAVATIAILICATSLSYEIFNFNQIAEADRSKYSHITSPIDPTRLTTQNTGHLAITLKFSKDSICINKISRRSERKYVDPIDRGIFTEVFSDKVTISRFWTSYDVSKLLGAETKFVDILINNDIYFNSFAISIPELDITKLKFSLSQNQIDDYLNIKSRPIFYQENDFGSPNQTQFVRANLQYASMVNTDDLTDKLKDFKMAVTSSSCNVYSK